MTTQKLSLMKSLQIGKICEKSSDLSVFTIIAVVYSILTVGLGSVSFSWLQIRVSEALTPLPFLMGFPAVIGLTLGCIISNVFSPVGAPDLFFGPLLTFIAAILSWKATFNRKTLSCIYPVLVNALGVSAYISPIYGIPYPIAVLTIGIGEFIAAAIIGYPLLVYVEKFLKSGKE
jgi:uncharacterized membrane protein